jgi:60 kDa SS-A/Ro ribonucleoprotein
MANRKLFNSGTSVAPRKQPNTRNKAGGRAYKFEDKHALAQYAVTGTFNNTFYSTAREQLEAVKKLVDKVDSEFLAKLAVYGHCEARMKDVPAYLLATLAARKESALVEKIFPQVISNAKMLCNFVQIMRSGVTGRRSFGTAIKRCIQNWLTSRDGKKLFVASIGHSDPSLADIVKMVHPRPETKEQKAVFAYLIGKDYTYSNLPNDVRLFEQWKAGDGEGYALPDIPFRALTNLTLGADEWREIANNMPWNTLRMNLNMLARKNVFKDESFLESVASRLSDEKEVLRSRVFPYQLLTAYQNTTDLPSQLKNGLQLALEAATQNVPKLDGKVVVAIDVSGSMSCPVTGRRGSASSVTRCVDVAALFAACVARKNPNALVLAFDCEGYGWGSRRGNVRSGLYKPELNAFDSVVTNATKLAEYGGGGTDCSLPLKWLNQEKKKVDSMIFVSDNESWSGYRGRNGGTQAEWETLRRRCPRAKLVNIDIAANDSSQTPDAKNEVLNIGGFNDAVWPVIDAFLSNEADVKFVEVIEGYVDL